MKHCINHNNKKAEYICHGCRKPYCELCITEGREYYYCYLLIGTAAAIVIIAGTLFLLNY